MGGISVIWVKNHFFILLNKFNVNTIIYDSLKFQISINWCGVIYHTTCKFLRHLNKLPYKGCFPFYISKHSLWNISTYSKCKGFYNFQAIRLKFSLYFLQSMDNKTKYQIFYLILQLKNKALTVETRNLVN